MFGVGAEVLAQISESEHVHMLPVKISLLPIAEAFYYLDAPMLRVTGADVPMPYAAQMEAAALPQIDNVCKTVSHMLNTAL